MRLQGSGQPARPYERPHVFLLGAATACKGRGAPRPFEDLSCEVCRPSESTGVATKGRRGWKKVGFGFLHNEGLNRHVFEVYDIVAVFRNMGPEYW